MKPFRFQSRYVSADDFRDLRRFSGLTRQQASVILSVSARTIQNWETGGARVPWMAYRMLRIVRGYELPGQAWEGWTLCGDTLYSPDNRAFSAGFLYHLRNVFAQAKLFRELYARSGIARPVPSGITVPDGLRAPPPIIANQKAALRETAKQCDPTEARVGARSGIKPADRSIISCAGMGMPEGGRSRTPLPVPSHRSIFPTDLPTLRTGGQL